jgi:hypothetical protein
MNAFLTVEWMTRYHPHGATNSGGLVAVFVHSLVASLGWHAGTSIAHLLGGWLVLLAIIAVLFYLARRARRWRSPWALSRRALRRRVRRGGRR